MRFLPGDLCEYDYGVVLVIKPILLSTGNEGGGEQGYEVEVVETYPDSPFKPSIGLRGTLPEVQMRPYGHSRKKLEDLM